ncbi:hypothetical protein [Alcaligenes sp. Lyrl_28]|uniref:hypothetical protein n=1 Tax=Alcaligenes sp. Lyrl_28 TaxID=3110924 RepID=UPI002BA9E24A|nr:hypothetical protein [Alcaligenes faecalis]
MQTFQWIIDANGDGLYSLKEILQTLRWAFRIPGSLVVETLGSVPYLSDVLRIQASEATGYASLRGGLVNILSLFFWAGLCLWFLEINSKPRAEPPQRKTRLTPHLHKQSDSAHAQQLHANHNRRPVRHRQVERHTF